VLANKFLDSGCDWLLMLDNDMIPPLNLLDMIDGADERMDILVPQFFAVIWSKNVPKPAQFVPRDPRSLKFRK
jgi:hypothetical protein